MIPESGPDAERAVRFDRFRFDPVTLELHEDGSPVHLPPKPARVLAALLADAGRLVRRETLYEAAWDDTVVSYDECLNAAIRTIRRALGDRADRPRFVETVPRRGYRFLAEVEPEPAPGDRFARRGRLRRVAAAAAIAVLLGAVRVGVGPRESHPTVSIATPLALDPSVDPWTGPRIEESIRSVAARDAPGVRVLAPPAPGEPDPPAAAYVIRSFLRTDGEGRTRLEVQLVRNEDRLVVWSGGFYPDCPRATDPTASIAGYVARVLDRTAT